MEKAEILAEKLPIFSERIIKEKLTGEEGYQNYGESYKKLYLGWGICRAHYSAARPLIANYKGEPPRCALFGLYINILYLFNTHEKFGLAESVKEVEVFFFDEMNSTFHVTDENIEALLEALNTWFIAAWEQAHIHVAEKEIAEAEKAIAEAEEKTAKAKLRLAAKNQQPTGETPMITFNQTLEELKNNSITRLYIRGYPGAGGATAIAEALRVSTSIATLFIYLCHPSAGGGIAYAEALKVNNSIAELVVYGYLGDVGTTAIAEALKVNNSVTKLYIYGRLSEDSAKALEELRTARPDLEIDY